MKYVELKPLDEAAHQPAPHAELLSALHDGQLDAISAAALVRASLNDEALMQQWRSMSAVSAALSGYNERYVQVEAAQPQLALLPQEAANDSIFRWKMVAGFAAVAAVGSIVWGLVGQQAAPSGAQFAQQTPAPLSQSVQPNVVTVQANSSNGQDPLVMIRDPRLDELLAAHKQFGGMSALQQPAGSLRSVSLVSTRP
jgi:sigma-E factor negative regulatory protein RseA